LVFHFSPAVKGRLRGPKESVLGGKTYSAALRIINPVFKKARAGNKLILMAEDKDYYQIPSSKSNFENWRCTKTKKNCCGRIHRLDGIYYLIKEHHCAS